MLKKVIHLLNKIDRDVELYLLPVNALEKVLQDMKDYYLVVIVRKNDLVDKESGVYRLINTRDDVAVIIDEHVSLNNMPKPVRGKDVIALRMGEKCYSLILFSSRKDTKRVPGVHILIDEKRVEIYKKPVIRSYRAKTTNVIHSIKPLENILLELMGEEGFYKVVSSHTRFMDENSFDIAEEVIPHNDYCRVEISSIEGFFESLMNMKYCKIFRSPLYAFTSIVEPGREKIIVPDSNWPATSSIIGLLGKPIIVPTFIKKVDKYMYEQVLEKKLLYIAKHSGKEYVVVASLPSIHGSSYFYKTIASLDAFWKKVIVDTMFTKPVKADYTVIIMRKLIPINMLTSTIVCSDKPLKESKVGEDLRKELCILEYFVNSYKTIYEKKKYFIKQYLKNIFDHIEAVNMESIYDTGYITILPKKDVCVSNIHKPIYSKYMGLYAIMFSGLEDNAYLEKAINEIVCGSSATPGLKSLV